MRFLLAIIEFLWKTSESERPKFRYEASTAEQNHPEFAIQAKPPSPPNQNEWFAWNVVVPSIGGIILVVIGVLGWTAWFAKEERDANEAKRSAVDRAREISIGRVAAKQIKELGLGDFRMTPGYSVQRVVVVDELDRGKGSIWVVAIRGTMHLGEKTTTAQARLQIPVDDLSPYPIPFDPETLVLVKVTVDEVIVWSAPQVRPN